MPVHGCLLTLLLTGCVIGLEQPGVPGDDDVTPPAEHVIGVMDAPRHGQVDSSDTATASLKFHGFASEPGAAISVQVLADPARPDSWLEIAKVTTSQTATQVAPGEQAYEWRVTRVPASVAPGAWPQGGLVRVRALFDDHRELTVFADDATACLAEHASWRDQLTSCGYHVTNGAIVVSPGSLVPMLGSTAPRGRFLDRKGEGSIAETKAYYAATGAPATLGAFKSKYGFRGSNEKSAAYFNRGDLAVGRNMHCVSFPSGAQTGVACYSANYGAFSGPQDDSLAKAIAGYQSGTGAFATVAMVYEPPITAPNAVSFVVYNAAGARINQAQLDRFGDNVGIPQTCMNCHGSASQYDATTHAVSDARFVPFDPAAFAFSTQPGFTFADQADQFRALNTLVQQAGAAPGVDELISGFDRGAQMDVKFMPDAWKETVEEATVYRNVVAPYCRGCHASYAGSDATLAFRTAADLHGNAARVANEACGSRAVADVHGMPSAEVVGEQFLGGPARAYLADLVGATGACVYGQP